MSIQENLYCQLETITKCILTKDFLEYHNSINNHRRFEGYHDSKSSFITDKIAYRHNLKKKLGVNVILMSLINIDVNRKTIICLS